MHVFSFSFPFVFSRRAISALTVVLLTCMLALLPFEVFAQTSLDGTTSGIDNAVCSFLKLMQRFGFYILIGSLILIAFAINLGEGRDIVVRGIQIIGGVWLLINVIAIADMLTGGRLSSNFNCSLT
jgi:hypothetical protein